MSVGSQILGEKAGISLIYFAILLTKAWENKFDNITINSYLRKKTCNIFLIFFKIREGISLPDARGAWRVGENSRSKKAKNHCARQRKGC